MFYTIYQITNKINGKIYIGKHQTKDLNDGYMGSGKHLRCAIEKYGIENFTKEILFKFDNETDMNAKEAELVTEEFCLKEDNYNLCPGGHGGWGYINNSVWSEEKRLEHNRKHSPFKNFTKEKRTEIGKLGISKIPREKILEGASNGGKAGLGRKHSDETKSKIGLKNSINQSGDKNSQYGIPRNEETKNKMRETIKNKPNIKCIFCDFESNNLGIISRWHNENCKKRYN